MIQKPYTNWKRIMYYQISFEINGKMCYNDIIKKYSRMEGFYGTDVYRSSS